MSADWDINTTFAFWSLAVGVVGTALAAWAFLPGWQDYATWLKADPGYRQKTATALRHPRWVAFYRHALAKGLDWLDRRFGEANSARALGVCTVISLCYAWAAFFLSYGLGAPGRLGEIELLPRAAGFKERATLVAIAVVLPIIAYLLGRWLGGRADRAERQFKARLLHRRRQTTTRRRFERRYRFMSALIFALAVLIPLVPSILSHDDPPDWPLGVVFGFLFSAAVAFGILAARQTRWAIMKGPVAALAGAVALAVAIGALTATRWARQDRRGAFAGGVGILLLLAILSPAINGNVDSKVSILVITFFMLLPLANGLWDWLSWWVSRWLGRDLLRRLASGERQIWSIVGHGVLDLVLALALLASLAFALAFGVEGYNQFAEWRSGSGVYDLAAFVREAAAAPWTEGFWLTAMLLSTLVPTFLHFALLLASPLALAAGSAKRVELAAALEGYDTSENQDAVLQNVGWHLARTQYQAWAGAALLTVLLLALIAGFVRLIHQGGLADYVADIAVLAIDLARWLF